MLDNIFDGSIICIGCSFTSGIGRDGDVENWPFFLSRIIDDMVINMAQAGSSLLHATHTLEYIYKNNYKPKFIFFQVTNPCRLTLRKNSISRSDYYSVTDNFYYPVNDAITCTINNPRYKWVERYYYERDPDNDMLWGTENRSNLSYVKKLLSNYNHFLYPQEEVHSYKPLLGDFNLIDSFFGEDYYNSNTIDDGMHLNNTALKKQAEYMMTKIY